MKVIVETKKSQDSNRAIILGGLESGNHDYSDRSSIEDAAKELATENFENFPFTVDSDGDEVSKTYQEHLAEANDCLNEYSRKEIIEMAKAGADWPAEFGFVKEIELEVGSALLRSITFYDEERNQEQFTEAHEVKDFLNTDSDHKAEGYADIDINYNKKNYQIQIQMDGSPYDLKSGNAEWYVTNEGGELDELIHAINEKEGLDINVNDVMNEAAFEDFRDEVMSSMQEDVICEIADTVKSSIALSM